MSICEDCVYYAYDEEYDDYICEQDLDEDEYAALMEKRRDACPFYHPGNSDYFLAGKK
ncbi:MAG: hypothetical protein IJV43_00775 [Oscillospiraceae bacterium]|nr:hypothetical protein [Oscillospiraceae bacterium]